MNLITFIDVNCCYLPNNWCALLARRLAIALISQSICSSTGAVGLKESSISSDVASIQACCSFSRKEPMKFASMLQTSDSHSTSELGTAGQLVEVE